MNLLTQICDICQLSVVQPETLKGKEILIKDDAGKVIFHGHICQNCFASSEIFKKLVDIYKLRQ